MSHNENHTSSEEIKLQMLDFIQGNMSSSERKTFTQWMHDNPQFSEELDALQSAHDLMQQHDQMVVPEPTTQMDQNFYAMLEAETKSQTAKENQSNMWQQIQGWLKNRFQNSWQSRQLHKVAYGLTLMFFGVFIGHYVHLLDDQSNIEAERLAIKDQQIQALAVLSLLDMPSANKRIMAVNLAGEMRYEHADKQQQPYQAVIDALLTTLNQDDNVNVRLEVIDVLSQFSESYIVRTGLINAIYHQESPMVQLAIAQLMLQLNEQQAIKPIQRLLDKPETLEPVRATLNETLKELI